ncbi:glycosyltransferase family 4 protein [Vibrio splendidus]|uniref:glycosyltransferase family 4 protein n=1 Tax=Vibrio splendidus TaxID=29497 RepID=UPI000C82971B|nr:glycosyltransferase family 4 protein [Vibrio splendidus]PMI72804.1 glycosyltransferase WbuB [Vibrio splendidus]
MKIAIFSDDYLPESTRVHAKMLHELALELKSLGNEVIVITPGHPEQQTLLSVCFCDGVEVWRFKSGLLRGNGYIQRALNETLLSFRAWMAINDKIKDYPLDLCINYSPTIFFGPLMHWIKKKQNPYIYLVLRDIFPMWAIDEGIIKEKSIIAKYFRYFERLNYRASDQIGLMSQSTLNHFKSFYPEYHKLSILPNWANHNLSDNLLSIGDIRSELGIVDKVIFFYGGNIGHAQDVFNLLALAKRMESIPEVHFLFVGQGDCTVNLLGYCKEHELKNVDYLPSVEQSAYEGILTQVDVGMVSLAESHTVNHYPGKILGYMKHSLPILACLNPGNDLADLINDSKAGFGHSTLEKESLFLSAKRLSNSQSLRSSMGGKSRQLLLEKFSTESATRSILSTLESGCCSD